MFDPAPFELLRSVEVTLDKPLSENFALPPTLETIFGAAASPIVGIPPQVKTLDVYGHKNDVVINSFNVRSVSLYIFNNVTLLCPWITDLTLDFCGQSQIGCF